MARLSLCAAVAALALTIGTAANADPSADQQKMQKQSQSDTPLYTAMPASTPTPNSSVVQAPRDPEAADTPFYTQMPAEVRGNGTSTKDPQDPYSHP